MITIQLKSEEALVLFELLAEFTDQPMLNIPTPAERQALIRLHGSLESVLVGPFQIDYSERIKDAR